ncbi:UNVERIFIED_CONTAM: hypothetical protein HDU68_009073 [Siphonaria sp. JEL0065]|nr:hypothetical protein HDU68_009073 [Siphonaria sp. JEL0065]
MLQLETGTKKFHSYNALTPCQRLLKLEVTMEASHTQTHMQPTEQRRFSIPEPVYFDQFHSSQRQDFNLPAIPLPTHEVVRRMSLPRQQSNLMAANPALSNILSSYDTFMFPQTYMHQQPSSHQTPLFSYSGATTPYANSSTPTPGFNPMTTTLVSQQISSTPAPLQSQDHNTPPDSSQSPPPAAAMSSPDNKLLSFIDPANIKKTHRFKAKENDLKCLMAVFEKNPFPSVTLRKKLADRLGLEQKQVQFWFQNRRATLKINGIHVVKPKVGGEAIAKPNLIPLTAKSGYFFVEKQPVDDSSSHAAG